MQLKYSKNLIPAVNAMQKVSSIAWASNGKKFAIATSDRIIYLYDQNGNKKDKIATKASQKGQKTYAIRDIQFSPDSQKMAVAQTDNIVFIYKIGSQWGDKKSICNKYPVTSQVTCLTWPNGRDNQIYFGLVQGKVRCGTLKQNKSNVIYVTDAFVVSITSNRQGDIIISGHLDGSIYSYNIVGQNSKKLIIHHSIPYALGYGKNIVAAGHDAKVTFYDDYGNLLQRFDYTNQENVRDFTLAAFNPMGDSVMLGNYNMFYIYNYQQERGQWQENSCKYIQNYYTVTAGCWKNDGSKLLIGSLCGSVDLYVASIKKINYKNKFIFNYVSPSQVVVQQLSTGKKSNIKSFKGYQITKIDIHKERYLYANTNDTIILGNLQTNKMSQILWRGSGSQKFDFSSSNVCIIFNVGQITLIEYGINQPIGTCRTQFMKPNLMSTKIYDKGNKIMAYLLDAMTICINNLKLNTTLTHISHDSKIEYLQLNTRANKLLFKDKRKQLYLYDIQTLTKNTLLQYCSFVKWVPNSEVVVAQNKGTLCVWYAIDIPQKMTTYSIKGDVIDIQRKNNKTQVIVLDGSNTIQYYLDESLIQFGFALQSKDFEKAANILGNCEITPQTQSNLKNLAKTALSAQNLTVAQHCYSNLGDISKAAYIRKILKIVQKQKEGINHYKVQAKLAILEKQFDKAQSIFLSNNQTEQAMQMYLQLHKWDQAIRVAILKNHPEVQNLKADYYNWLLKTKQQQKAAQVNQQQGKYQQAVNLYLKGGLPARAATVVISSGVEFNQSLIQKIATALQHSGMYQKAGQFYQEMGKLQKALDCYCKGEAFKKAVDLARRDQPRLVVSLQQKWGDYLVSIKQTQNAINHYSQAGATKKAIQAAINSRQWNKAIQLLQHQIPEVSRPFYKQIAQHYANIRQYDFAQKYFLKAGLTQQAFEMYAKANKWELALKVARQNMIQSEIVTIYVKMAQKFQQQGKLKEAQKMYLTVEEPDLAIEMYKRIGQYQNMIRLVSKYRNNHLKDTHLAIAQKLQKQGNLKIAQQHYIDAGAWRTAVEMYKNRKMWQEAVRCCKLYGSDKQTSELARQWAQILGDQGLKKLIQMNLIDAVIDFLSDKGEFDEAYKMAATNSKHKTKDVHLKHAFHLEDEKRYKQAEEYFIKAGKANQAINMYIHIGDFHSALQVSNQYFPQQKYLILLEQAKMYIQKRDYTKAQNCFIQAKKPQTAIKMYCDIGKHSQALRVAKRYAPHLVGNIDVNAIAQQQQSPEQKLQHAKTLQNTRQYKKAIKAYLQLTKQDFPANKKILVDAWERAAQLASNYEQDVKTIKIVANKLIEVQMYEHAAGHLFNINQYENAIKIYCKGKHFQKAIQCLTYLNKNSQTYQTMKTFIQKSRIMSDDDPISLIVTHRQVKKGLDIFFQKKDYDNCLNYASKEGGQILGQYMNKIVKKYNQQGKFGQAIAIYSKYGMQLIPSHYNLYKVLSLEIFVECEAKEISSLKQALYNFFNLLESTTDSGNVTYKQFERYLIVSHLADLKHKYINKGPNCLQLLTKTCISLLRYCDLIRIDKVYYQAGINCQKSVFFHLLEQFFYGININEIIQDADNNNLGDNNQFQITDIPSPYDVPLPDKNFLTKPQKQKIRDWLLQTSINQKVQQVLPTRKCDKCNTSIYEPSLTCYKCKARNQICIITGYPVLYSNMMKCRSCGKPGVKQSWTIYLQNFANCPWCNNPPN